MTTTVIKRNTVLIARDREVLSWGSVLGGLFVAIAISWLLALLGTAIGVSIADASDAEAVGAGLGIAASLWLLLSFLAAYFVGALVAGRLSGSIEDDHGMLHGIAMWGVSIVVSAVISIGGIAGALQAGASALGAIGASSADLVENLDVDADVVSQITNTAEFDRIRATAVKAARKSAAEAVGENSAALTEGEVNTAIQQIDSDSLVGMGLALMKGNPERAKDILTSETTLTDAQVEAVVTSVEREARAEIQQLEAEAKQAAEAASTYATATLWALFAAIALALIASIVGGRIGTSTVRRLSVA